MSGPLAQLYKEHSSLSAVLHAMLSLVREVRERGRRVDPKVFARFSITSTYFSSASTTTRRKPCCFRLRQRTHDADTVLDQSRANTNQAKKRFAR